MEVQIKSNTDDDNLSSFNHFDLRLTNPSVF